MDTSAFSGSTQVLRGPALTYLTNTSNLPWLSTVAANTVLYETASGSCFLVSNPSARTIFHLAGDPTDTKWNMFSVNDFNKYQSLVTNSPTGEPNIPVPPLGGVSARGGQLACNSFDTAYGRKRMLRRREYFAMAALPRLPNEVNSMSLAARQDLLSDNTAIAADPTEQGCNFEDTPAAISPDFAALGGAYASANRSFLFSPKASDYGSPLFKEIIGRDVCTGKPPASRLT